jgi:hypothetical protein
MGTNATISTLAVTTAALLTIPTQATFVGFVATVTQVTSGGMLLDQVRVVARFNGPTDTLLNAFNFNYQGGATVADPHGAFWHKDNSDYNGGVLSKQYGTWAPSLTGSATLNRPFDSFLTIGGTATATNTTSNSSSSWNQANLPFNMSWFNGSPPNNQGRVGVPPNTATDVLIGQFILDRGASAGNWVLTIGYNDGVAGSPVQFATSSFAIGAGVPCPTLYRDLDGDGFGSTSSGTVSSCTPVTGYVSNNTDCNDSNAAINPNTTWYRDTDGDGVGAAVNGTIVQCTQPAGYVLGGSDNCPNIANANQADANNNGLGDVCEFARGDLNLDGVVNASDVPLFFNAWGSAGPLGDLNFDGVVNSTDFTILLNNWGTTP